MQTLLSLVFYTYSSNPPPPFRWTSGTGNISHKKRGRVKCIENTFRDIFSGKNPAKELKGSMPGHADGWVNCP